MKTITFMQFSFGYGCSEPGNNDGQYVRADVAQDLLEACKLTATAIREAMQAGDEDDARLSMAYARLVVKELDVAIGKAKQA